ncbi:MAG: class I SAM-dependent methyltransferase [Thermoplasmata archaeon]|nr:class I SAM-dependent methyltransferase [Thermoplasmata archaeon]
MDGTRSDDPVADLLPRYWTELGIPPDQWPYLAFQARRYPSILRFLAPLAPLHGRKVLDLGGGVGSLAVALHAAFGGDYHLAEVGAPRPRALEVEPKFGISAFHTVELGVSAGLAALPTDYDLILLVEVVEHLLGNPLFLFRELHGHLRPGGRLLITTPNQARLTNRLRLLLGRSIKDPRRYPRNSGEVNGHVIEYTRKELDILLASERFRPERHEVVQQPPSPLPGLRERAGVRLLNLGPMRRLELGDNIRALYAALDLPLGPISPGERV